MFSPIYLMTWTHVPDIYQIYGITFTNEEKTQFEYTKYSDKWN